MRIIYIGYLLLFLSLQGYGQKETYNWAFGVNAGLSFHPNSLRSFAATGLSETATANATLHNLPGAFSTSVSNLEGVFSISDKEGNLLFYSNGMQIWKADGSELFDGLGGGSSSAQSGIVLSFPGDETQFICIGLYVQDGNRMNYVIVKANSPTDVSVTGTPKAFAGQNGKVGESMSAIRHANGKDWWIVAPGKGSPMYFNAWLATPSGVAASSPEKITNSGINVEANSSNGYFKFTPDGKHFVYPTWTGEKVIYGDFNNQTGEFSNIRQIPGGRYGAEFSPNQKYLYMTTANAHGLIFGLYIWDFEALLQGTASGPVRYIYLANIAALQQDLFGRIWGASASLGRNMYLIENPDEPDNLKMYVLENFLSEGAVNQYGLPSFSASWFDQSIKTNSESFCVNTSQSFSAYVTKGTGANEISKTEWDFGDGSAVISDTNVDGNTQTHNHTYKKKGVYTVTLKAFRASDGTEVAGLRQRIKVVVASCSLPVNHNVSTLENF